VNACYVSDNVRGHDSYCDVISKRADNFPSFKRCYANLFSYLSIHTS